MWFNPNFHVAAEKQDNIIRRINRVKELKAKSLIHSGVTVEIFKRNIMSVKLASHSENILAKAEYILDLPDPFLANNQNLGEKCFLFRTMLIISVFVS